MSTPDRRHAPSLAEMADANQARVNARVFTAGRCMMHGPDLAVDAQYVIEVPIGNTVPVCRPCLEHWIDDWQAGYETSAWVAIRPLNGRPS